MKYGVKALLFTAVFFAGSAAANAGKLSPGALNAVRRIVIQHAGRQKPFDSFAREALNAVTGAVQWEKQDPVETVLLIIADPDHWQSVALVSVPFVPLRQPIGLDSKTSRISYNDLVATRKLMRMLPAIMQKQQRNEKFSMLENETMDAFQRFVTLSGLLEGKVEVVPPPSGKGSWMPIAEPKDYSPEQQAQIKESWAALMAAVNRNDSAAVVSAANRFVMRMRQANPSAYPASWRIELELFYNKRQPFHVARVLYLLAFLSLVMSLSIRKGDAAARLGYVSLIAACLIHLSGILMRVIVGGRPPVSNFFETMLWLPFVAVTVSLVFERIYRAKYFGVAASLLSAIMLWLADYVPLDSSITPVVAVLRSNLWLTIHVLTIVASYGAIALAAVLAHIYGWLYIIGRHRDRSLKSLGLFLYRSLQVGVVLLASGIMLGAVWANASWGRYWGWDPKETWALITLLWYIAILHGRFAGWIRGVGVALATIGGFFLLVMTYYGVSFYLVGLHSYAGGHAKPLPWLLVVFLIAEALFMAVVGTFARRRVA